jgi:hypothetical protein
MTNHAASTRHYLVKRSADFSRSGVLFKKNEKNKCLSDTVITASARKPVSANLQAGDVIYLAEKGGFIYAVGTVKGQPEEVRSITNLANTNDVFAFVKKNATIKSRRYWYDKLERLTQKQISKPDAVIRYHEYFIDQRLLDRTVSLSGPLKRLLAVRSIARLTDEEVSHIENPPTDRVSHLEQEIPSQLRMDIFSLFNRELSVSHWIDIDHFVPRAAGGPGNIIENLVPIGFSLNRYKSDAVPRALFETAIKKGLASSSECRRLAASDDEFLWRKKHPLAIDEAKAITQCIALEFSIEEARAFYGCVMQAYYPEYARIIEGFRQ